ncbi:MAG: glycosyltransferase [Chloroflexota bacterium]|nr:glycosyltransferase [Chloroflexota bacterium]
MSPLRITFLTAGSRGDVQPYVALGAGFKAAGHSVRVATFDAFEDFVSGFGLEYFPVRNGFEDMSDTEDWQSWQQTGQNVARYVYYLGKVLRTAQAELDQMLDDFWSACQGSDVVIGSSSAIGGPQIARRLGVPYFWALFNPMSRTRAFPHFLSPAWLRLGGHFNLFTYLVAEQGYWQLFGRAIDRWRRKTLQLPRLRGPGPYGLLGRSPYPVLYGFSEGLLPRPRDWHARAHVTGFWFLPSLGGWRPPARLSEFLAAGPPPVYVSLANINSDDPPQLLKLVLEALARVGRRGVLLLDSGTMVGQDLPDWVYPLDEAPHDWLFPRMAAIMHHGGIGTIAAALRAGVPSFGVPNVYDQPFWSRRLGKVGAGPTPIPPERLTVERLATAFAVATGDAAVRSRAAQLGERIRAEKGVETAVRVVHSYLNCMNGKRVLAL